MPLIWGMEGLQASSGETVLEGVREEWCPPCVQVARGRLIPAKYMLSSGIMPLPPTVSPKLPLSLLFKGIPDRSHSAYQDFSARRGRLKISTEPARWVHALIWGFDNRLVNVPPHKWISEIMREQGTCGLIVKSLLPRPRDQSGGAFSVARSAHRPWKLNSCLPRSCAGLPRGWFYQAHACSGYHGPSSPTRPCSLRVKLAQLLICLN